MKPSRTIFTFVYALSLFLSGLAPVASAQQGLPELKLEKYTLANGLQVIFHEDRKLPAVNVNLWYHVGSKNEKPGRTGFAHLFEHMMFQGSKHVEGEFLSLAERAGANLQTGGVNGTTNNDRTNYFETVPSESLEYALWLESDRMAFLLDALTEEKLNNQRDVVKNEKRQGENQPYGRAFSIIFEELFPADHPYAHSVIGSMEDLSAASLDDVKEFFRTYYTPNNATLAIVGNFDPAKAKVLIQKYFGPIAAGPALERPELYPVSLDAEKRVSVSDRVPQSRVYRVYPATAYFQADEAALDTVASVLADGKTSRLYKSLVYEKQLASDVNAFNYSLESAGGFFVIATARPGHTLAELEAAIDAEISKLAPEGPTADEIESAKAKRELGFVDGLQRIGGFGGKADIINTYNTYLGSPDHFAEDIARYRKVTAADVKAATAKYLDTTKRLVVSYEPETSGRADAQEFDRKTPPAFGARATFATPVPKTKTLANGLTVVAVERRELPSVSVSLVTKTGAAVDPAGKPGTAWMTAEMLDEGTTSRSALQLSGRTGSARFDAGRVRRHGELDGEHRVAHAQPRRDDDAHGGRRAPSIVPGRRTGPAA
ncbi:MAG: insulinase family protein [Blastocatellia bacterium]|nr:insulinase family protein [Blastocatellia bacterium]